MPELGLFSPFICGEKKNVLLVDTYWKVFSIAYFWHSWNVQNSDWKCLGRCLRSYAHSPHALFIFVFSNRAGTFCEWGKDVWKSGAMVQPGRLCLRGFLWCSSGVFIGMWGCFSENLSLWFKSVYKRKWLPPTCARVCFLPVCTWFL